MAFDTDKNLQVDGQGGFLSRWSRLKQQQATIQSDEPDLPVAENELKPLRDEDMPPIESLTEDSDYSGFLSPEVSDELRKLALRKLFSSVAFNVRDGLDDYDGDYTSFEKLGNLITADMKHQMEMQARKKLEAETSVSADATSPADSNEETIETAIEEDEVEADIELLDAGEDEMLQQRLTAAMNNHDEVKQ